jgi:N-methylhydantoinase B/oxoprolinase/acetone carboxylase alpha subunit
MADNEHAIHELIASTRELSNLIRIHEADIAALKAKVENNLRQSERLESMVHQIGDDVSAVRNDVTSKVNEMQIAVLNHIQNDEIAQNRILKTIIIAAFVNGLAVIMWLASSWYESGMPWPIFPWL